MFGFGKDDTNALTMNQPHPDSLLDTGVQGVISKPLDRVDGPKKVTGTATYAAEYAIENIAHGVLVSATKGHAKIKSIDADAVKAIPGVIDVITDYDTFIRNSQQGGETSAPTQGVRTIDYFGEIIAIVVAESFEVARDAAKRLKVDYEPLDDAAFDYEANKDKAEPAPDGLIKGHYDQGDFDQAFENAAVKVDVTYTTPSQNSAAMEPHASIAVWEDGALTLYGAYQMPTSTRSSWPRRWVSRSPRCGSSRAISAAVRLEAGHRARERRRRHRRQAAGPPGQGGDAAPAGVRRHRPPLQHRTANAPGAEAGGRIVALGHESITSNLPDEDFFEPVGIGTTSSMAVRIGGSIMTWCG